MTLPTPVSGYKYNRYTTFCFGSKTEVNFYISNLDLETNIVTVKARYNEKNDPFTSTTVVTIVSFIYITL